MWVCSYCNIHDVTSVSYYCVNIIGSHQRKQPSVWSHLLVDKCQASMMINIGDAFQVWFQVSDNCDSLIEYKRVCKVENDNFH